jgi:hypothetical protein
MSAGASIISADSAWNDLHVTSARRDWTPKFRDEVSHLKAARNASCICVIIHLDYSSNKVIESPLLSFHIYSI